MNIFYTTSSMTKGKTSCKIIIDSFVGGFAKEKRKLASVQYVHHVTQIEGADKIECVHVLGWKCVANKENMILEKTKKVL